MSLKDVMNPYDRQARLYPMVLVLLPLAIGAAVWLPAEVKVPGIIGSAVAVLAASTLLTQLARDQGKKREKELYRLWGGRPSDRALSYSARVFAEATLTRWHKKLLSLEPNLPIPESISAEKADPQRAKAAYASATDLLVAKTRDKGTYSMLFRENMSYGFRRNLWGMKAIGIITSCLGLAAAGAKSLLSALDYQPQELAPFVALGLCVLSLSIWIVRVTPTWVKIPADGYAKHLAEACETL